MNSNCASSSCEMDLSLSCCETQDLSWLKAFSFFFWQSSLITIATNISYLESYSWSGLGVRDARWK